MNLQFGFINILNLLDYYTYFYIIQFRRQWMQKMNRLPALLVYPTGVDGHSDWPADQESKREEKVNTLDGSLYLSESAAN